MGENGPLVASRLVDPILMKYRLLLIKKYGGEVFSGGCWDTRYSEVELYVQIEKLRDALARNEISRWEFAEKLLILTELRNDLSPDVQEIVRELYETLRGRTTPAERAGLESEVIPLRTRLGIEGVWGQCPCCASHGDLAHKVLERCRYCGKLYCEKHLQPKLALTLNQYQAYLARYRDIAHIIEEHWVKASGHPCATYTELFWKEYHRRGAKKGLGLGGGRDAEEGARESVRPEQIKPKKGKLIAFSALIFLTLLMLALSVMDFDGDGLPTLLEVQRRLNPLSGDSDGDGLSDSTELQLATDPLRSDSDGDGLTDRHELELGTSPLSRDTDWDGISDSDEPKFGTNPTNSDTDGDGLSDGFEMVLGTNPSATDTDRDGLSDAEELEKVRTDPLISDTDRDGLLDGYEFRIGTSPLRADSDGDELSDADELKLGTSPIISDTDGDELLDGFETLVRTDPLNSDTDEDGLLDGFELRIGTQPLNADTDRDGLLDGYEFRIGTNPLKNWRWFFDADTIKSALCTRLRAGVARLAQKLTGTSLRETVWNVLKWVDENIRYDYEKFRSERRDLYSPAETVMLGRGICADYALLTAALLLEAGARDVYVLVLSRISDPSSGHAAVAVVVNGRTYVLDQRLPPLRYEEYLHYLSASKLDWEVTQVYRVSLDTTGEPQVETVAPDRLPTGRMPSTTEISSVVYRVLLRLSPSLQWDARLESTALDALISEQSSTPDSLAPVRLPPGYREGVIQRLRMHPAVISEDFAEDWIGELLGRDETRSVIIKYRRVYITVGIYTLFNWKYAMIVIVLANP